MSWQEAETDGFEVVEVLTGPDDCRIVLNYNHLRFILNLLKPESPEDDDAVANLFLKLEEAEDYSDELRYDRCLMEVTDTAILACKGTMNSLAAAAPTSDSKQVSLEDFLYPTTFSLQLRSVNGKLQAVKMDDDSELPSILEPPPLMVDSIPRSAPAPTPSVEIEFMEDLFMGKIFKVSLHGQVRVFKSAIHGNADQLKREISVLQQVSEKRDPDRPDHPRVPQFFGLVKSRGQVIGMLESFIEGKNLYQLSLANTSSTERRIWKRQIEQAITWLHERGIVWGDVKPENVLIDTAADAWLVDFGGSWTDGWVDEELAETVEGDLQGLLRLNEFLDMRRREGLSSE
ncbi:hypothetical protein DV735_g3890, partial [Chaetothyriales sp. CBS 134920]